MHWIDWLIVVVPVVFILWLAFYSRRYIRGVVDYLAAGRVAGRYVLSIGSLESCMSIVVIASSVEARYQTGFAIGFWDQIMMPIGVVLGLTGFCWYRFRETKALSAGQFLEMRYSRPFRIVASTMRVLAEIMANSIAPAVAANFFIYFLGLPHRITVLGVTIPMFALVMLIVISMAIWVMWFGGRIALLITDCLQGIISYPVFVIITTYMLYTFSWDLDIAPVMLDRVAGESFLNPYDISELRDFNLFSLIYLAIARVLHQGNWIGGETSGCGKTPHEQKMSGILGTWKNGFAWIMCFAIAIMVISVMNAEHFSPKAKEIRTEMAIKVSEELIKDPAKQAEIAQVFQAIPEQKHVIGQSEPLSNKKNLETVYYETAAKVFADQPEPAVLTQKFRALYRQIMMAVAMKNLLPFGVMGMFCLLMVMLMLSTDDTRIMNSSVAIIQDIVVPLRKNPMTPELHVTILKYASVGVSVFFFFASLLFSQMDYILMYTAIMAGIWNGAAGPIMLGGLYTRWGNTTGAWSALVVGSGISGLGMFCQRTWSGNIYPFLERMGWVEAVSGMFTTLSAPLDPLIVWEVTPYSFPMNSYEILFLASMSGIIAYVIGSFATYKGAYNLDRMLHRGEYSDGHWEQNKGKMSVWQFFMEKFVGITSEYTRGDRIITWSVFIYSFVYNFFLAFIVVIVWNLFSPWSNHLWSMYFYYTLLIIPCVVGVISTVWFMWGGIVDSLHLFRDLKLRVENPLDDGRVEGQISLMDKAEFEAKKVQSSAEKK